MVRRIFGAGIGAVVESVLSAGLGQSYFGDRHADGVGMVILRLSNLIR